MSRIRPYTEDALSQIFFGHLVQKCVLVCHIPNEGKRTTTNAARLKRMGLVKGPPDYLIIHKYNVVLDGPGIYVVDNRPAKLLAVEIKTAGKRPTRDQLRWLAAIGASGNGAYWIQGYEGVRSALACFGATIGA